MPGGQVPAKARGNIVPRGHTPVDRLDLKRSWMSPLARPIYFLLIEIEQFRRLSLETEKPGHTTDSPRKAEKTMTNRGQKERSQ
jgi:hypothetical protein